MSVKIIKIYKGTNIIKVKTKTGLVRFGYRWTFAGRKYQKATWESKEKAEDALAKFKLLMRNPNRLGYENETITLDALTEAWKRKATIRGISKKRIHEITTYIERLRDVSRCKELRQLNETHFTDYQADRIKNEIHPHTINKELDMIRTCLRAAPKLFPGFNWQPPDYERLPLQHQGREVVLSRDELLSIVRALEEAVPESNQPERFRRALARDVVIVGIETTMRMSELALLEKSQVHLQRGIGYKHGHLAIKNAKTNKPKVIPITANVAEILKRRLVENPGRYIFKPEKQKVDDFGRMIRRAYKNACKKVGVHYGLKSGGAVFHTIRHSTTTYLVNKKLPLSQVMAITGHSKKTTLLIYAHPTVETVEEATELLTMDFGGQENEKVSNE